VTWKQIEEELVKIKEETFTDDEQWEPCRCNEDDSELKHSEKYAEVKNATMKTRRLVEARGNSLYDLEFNDSLQEKKNADQLKRSSASGISDNSESPEKDLTNNYVYDLLICIIIGVYG